MYKLILMIKPYHAEHHIFKVMLIYMVVILITKQSNTPCISWYWYQMYLDSII